MEEKTLVAYFSASNVTKVVAEKIAAEEGADLYEITPKQLYTEDDLNWMDKHSRSTLEMSDLNCRPEIEGAVKDFDSYKFIFVGFPIWWGREPSVVDTFLEAYDFSGKTVIPFCTSGGSGFGKTGERIQSLVGEKTRVLPGKRLGGNVTAKDLERWVKGH